MPSPLALPPFTWEAKPAIENSSTFARNALNFLSSIPFDTTMQSFRYFVLGLLLLNAASAWAQRDKVKNLNDFDNKKIHFGFTLGINTADFAMESDLSLSDSLAGIQSVQQSGFNIGIISDLHLSPTLGLRFTPDLSFGQRNLEYSFLRSDGTASLLVKKVESTWLNLPLSLKYRSFRLNNFASYFIVGGRYSFDFASQENTDNQFNDPNEIVIKLARNSYSAEVGVGFDFFLTYFKFSPELKFVQGINNLIINDNTPLSDPISSLRSRIFVLSFHFEG
ncbi:MAG: porin family protein [Salibacteraceae bacterium]